MQKTQISQFDSMTGESIRSLLVRLSIPAVTGLYSNHRSMKYVSYGARSRNATVMTNGAFDYSVGKTPAPVVDLKAGVRFLRLNADAIPGDEDKIVSVGTSGAGQMSSALGASGNMEAYYPYLYEIGAAGVQYENGAYTSTIRDDIYGCMCYCPIADINNADLAYAWWRYDFSPNSYTFTDFKSALQDYAAEAYAEYLNGLGIRDLDDSALTLDSTRDGTADQHTSFTVAYNIAMAANMAGAEGVDYSLVWAMGHGNNEGTTTGTFIDWIKDIC